MEEMVDRTRERFGLDIYKNIVKYDKKTDSYRVAGYWIQDGERVALDDRRWFNPKGKWVVYRLYVYGEATYDYERKVWRGGLLYVGQTSDFNSRIKQHRQRPWFKDVTEIEFHLYDSEAEARVAEALAIHNEDPKWNVTRQEHLPFSNCKIIFHPREDQDCACWNVNGYRPYRNYSARSLDLILKSQWNDDLMNKDIVAELLIRLMEIEGAKDTTSHLGEEKTIDMADYVADGLYQIIPPGLDDEPEDE